MRVETSDIYEDLKRKLMTAELPPGQKLKPAELQGAYGVSANTIRDVLLRLSTVGLVAFELQRGFRAQDATLERRRDVTRFRILLEQEGLALAIRHAGLEWEVALSAAHHKLSHIESHIAQTNGRAHESFGLWSDAETEFHETLISPCGSDLMRQTFRRVYAQFRQQMVGYSRDFGSNYFEAINQEHQAIVDAALARDETAARTAVYNHLSRNL